jgi:hypothetical protein
MNIERYNHLGELMVSLFLVMNPHRGISRNDVRMEMLFDREGSIFLELGAEKGGAIRGECFAINIPFHLLLCDLAENMEGAAEDYLESQRARILEQYEEELSSVFAKSTKNRDIVTQYSSIIGDAIKQLKELDSRLSKMDSDELDAMSGLIQNVRNERLFLLENYKVEKAEETKQTVEKEEPKIIHWENGKRLPEGYTGCVQCVTGTKFWYKEGRFHRLDGPAIEYTNGRKFWYIDGTEYYEEDWKKEVEKSKVLKLKNGDSIPQKYTGCVEYGNGDKCWYKEGKWHRLDGPAIERADGYKSWYIEGKIHRLDGPACEYTNGSKHWYKEGKLHREDGPACEYDNGDKYWYKEGKYHSLDGPAIELTDGTKKWFIEGFYCSEEEWKKKVGRT